MARLGRAQPFKPKYGRGRAFFINAEDPFSLGSKKSTTDFTDVTKNTTDFTPVEKNTNDWTDP